MFTKEELCNAVLIAAEKYQTPIEVFENVVIPIDDNFTNSYFTKDHHYAHERMFFRLNESRDAIVVRTPFNLSTHLESINVERIWNWYTHMHQSKDKNNYSLESIAYEILCMLYP